MFDYKPDWKFVATSVITIALSLIPLFLTKWDNSRQLTAELVSLTAIEPPVATSVPKIKVTYDGSVLETPYLAVIKITNSGSQAIQPNDFEDDIEISVKNSSLIASANISSVNPSQLRPVHNLSGNTWRLKPLLLNSEDSIELTLVTSGQLPDFNLRARIAGISSVSLEDKSHPNPSLKKYLALPVGLVLLAFYPLGVYSLLRRRELRLNKLGALAFALSTMFGSLFILAPFLRELELPRLVTAAMPLLAVVIASILGKRLFTVTDVGR